MGLSPDQVKPKTITLVCVTSPLLAHIIKEKDLLVQNQDNVSVWGDMSIRGLGELAL